MLWATAIWTKLHQQAYNLAVAGPRQEDIAQAQAQLDAYYKNADLPLAQAAIDRFIRLNPTHPNIDYVMYMRGLGQYADHRKMPAPGKTHQRLNSLVSPTAFDELHTPYLRYSAR